VDYNDFDNCVEAPSQAHPITGNPLFYDATSDWHLKSGSPAIQHGADITVTGFQGETLPVNRDKDGNVRKTPWDLGVFAYDKRQ
jgi:hypothetical protein